MDIKLIESHYQKFKRLKPDATPFELFAWAFRAGWTIRNNCNRFITNDEKINVQHSSVVDTN